MDTWVILLTILLGVISVHWWYIARYFKQRNIPHRTPLPILGNMLPFFLRRKHTLDLQLEYYNRWPDAKYYGMYSFLNKPIIVIRDPELIKTITVKNFDNFMNHQGLFNDDLDPLLSKSLVSLKGEKWRTVRSMLTPAFTSSKMKMMFVLMSDCAKNVAIFLSNEVKMEGIPIQYDIKDVVMKYTNDVIATCAFGIKVDSMRNPENEFYVLGKTITTFHYSALFKGLLVLFAPKLANILNLRIIDKTTTHFFKNVIKETIKNRQEKGIYRPDMIQQILDAKDEENDVAKIDIEEMIAQAFTFFLGGFATSAALASFVSMELAVNPDVQRKLQEEIDIVLKESKGNADYDTINGMPYLEAVLNETLRFYPNVIALDRVCNEKFELPPPTKGSGPVTVEPGENILIAAYGIHFDPKYYDKPEQFDPDRFLNKKTNINKSTFLAFGIGPRSCIGNRFAMLENKLFLFHLLARCNLKPTEKTPIPLKFDKSSFELIFENGFNLKVEDRKHSYFGSIL